MRRLWLVTALLALCVQGSVRVATMAAAETTLSVTGAWAYESPPTVTNGVAYLTVLNQGTAPDRLVGVAGAVSEAVELHTHVLEGSMMKMRRVEAVELRPGIPAVLQPGGDHIMLIGLKQPLVAGQTFPLRLRFEVAGEIGVDVNVRKYGEKHH